MKQEKLLSALGNLHNRATGWIILAISILITVLAWHTSNLFLEKRAQDRFEFKVEEAHWSILKRMREYEQVLRGGVGLLNTAGEVTREDWHHYVTTLQIDTYWPGIQGIGFTRMIPPEEREGLERQIQAEGFPGFAIRPEGKRDQYSAILFLEPFSGRNLRAFGYDMWSESIRRAAMQQARDSGQAALSGRVTLVQETDRDVQPGFLMYLPVYKKDLPIQTVEQRRSALHGFVYSPFRMRDLMEGILGHGDRNLDFELYDGGQPDPTRLLHSTHAMDHPHRTPARYQHDSRMELPGGRIWLARFASRPIFEQELKSHQSLIIALLGMTVDLLLFAIVWSLAGQKERIQHQAHRIAMALNQAELRYRTIVENIKDVIFQTDFEGRWSFLNPAWEEVSGYTVEESLGRSFLNLLHPDEWPRSVERLEKMHKGQLHFSHDEYRGIHQSGRPLWLELHFSMHQDEQGHPIGLSGILRDITMRKEIETMMVRAREAAESANRAKSEFLANMSHELRSPLNSLLILSKLLSEDRSLNEEQIESVRVIHQSGHDLLTLINDILDLSKVEAGRMEVITEPIDLTGFSRELLAPFHAIANHKGLSLHLELEEGLPDFFNTDGAKLKQILGNFLSNALKFTEQGRVTLQIQRANGNHPTLTTNSDTVLVFRVLDTGVGIPEDKREWIFETFSQVDGATSRKYGGTGLGLAIARKLTALLHGAIQLHSRPDAGSAFALFLPALPLSSSPFSRSWSEEESPSIISATRLALPRSHLPQNAADPTPTSPLSTTPFLINGQPATLLVVDDDMRMAFSIASGLQNRVEHVLLAASGAKALKQLEQHPEIGAILLDMRMPEMDGFATIQAIRADSRYHHLAILALTAMARPEDAVRCLEAGADGYLAKPAPMDAIWAKLEEICAARSRLSGHEKAIPTPA
ncbi:MAG: PAS domain S-box protein [Magnetococcales bacterium]|nr:CHASE domain-containing protein [Magnetococcales bacterium]NGZ07205.1 PAS domain S-box protein [Magnetococcales bacterium]